METTKSAHHTINNINNRNCTTHIQKTPNTAESANIETPGSTKGGDSGHMQRQIRTMAKSLRSKWKRKCRAVKRERYGAKELAKLKKTLVIGAKDIIENSKTKEGDKAETIEMEVDGGRVYDKKTLRDQYGNYPVWMNRRKILKHKKGRAKAEKGTTKTNKRLTRRQKNALKEKK
ncbi:hypothetical protein M0802_005060 [Mischocyttarus mexicanus]|nr:hypothetical protein M0802_005060 [Mischocyttarus mexicanus]